MRAGSWKWVVGAGALVFAFAVAILFAARGASAHALLVPADSGGSYVVHRPANLSRSKPVPLVVECCRGDGLAPKIGLGQLADAKGFVVAVVKPTKVYNSPSESGKTGTMLPDMQYVKSVIATVSASENIDPARIYVIGASQGAFFALRAACDLSNIVAAVGSIAGGNGMQPCSPSRAVSVIDVSGAKDPFVPPSFGQAVADRWRVTDRCGAQPRVTNNGGVTDQLWTGCALGTSVELVLVGGVGHAWIRTAQYDATQELWQFFSQHPLVTQASTVTAHLVRVRVRYRPSRRILVSLTVGQKSSVRLWLARGSRTVANRRAQLPAGKDLLALKVPRGARGTYRLRLTVAASGVTRSFARSVRITH